MDAYKREQKIARDIQLAIAKLSHLNQLMRQINKEIKKAAKIVDEAKEEFENLRRYSQ